MQVGGPARCVSGKRLAERVGPLRCASVAPLRRAERPRCLLRNSLSLLVFVALGTIPFAHATIVDACATVGGNDRNNGQRKPEISVSANLSAPSTGSSFASADCDPAARTYRAMQTLERLRKLLAATFGFFRRPENRGSKMPPEARVKAFIADYRHAHSQLMAKPAEPRDQFERWEALIAVLDQAHFVGHAGRRLSQSFSGESAYGLAIEPIIGTRRAAERVFVETCVDVTGSASFYEYELQEASAGDWRIVRLREFLDPPDAPFMTAQEKPRFENPEIHPLRELPTEEARFDGGKIFDPGRPVELDGEKSAIELREVGMLDVTTGMLVVGDLGYDTAELRPLGQRILPGSYPTDVAVAFERNVALRVRFSDRKVVGWHPADMGTGGHCVVADAGNIAIMDVAAIMTIDARAKERAFESYAETRKPPESRMLSLAGTNDAAIADSGLGDGDYPAYWGVDADGKPVALVVEFLPLP